MRRRCIICDAKLSKKGRRVCFSCASKGPHGHDDYLIALIYGCSGTNYKGKPCRHWAQIGSHYCNSHGKVNKNETTIDN